MPLVATTFPDFKKFLESTIIETEMYLIGYLDK